MVYAMFSRNFANIFFVVLAICIVRLRRSWILCLFHKLIMHCMVDVAVGVFACMFVWLFVRISKWLNTFVMFISSNSFSWVWLYLFLFFISHILLTYVTGFMDFVGCAHILYVHLYIYIYIYVCMEPIQYIIKYEKMHKTINL